MKKLLLAVVLVFSGCSLQPVIASTDSQYSFDVAIDDAAYSTCEAGGVTSSECVEIIADEYVDAFMKGARNHMEGSDLTPKQAILEAIEITQCSNIKSAVCEIHVQQYAIWFITGQRTVESSKQLQVDYKNYFKGL